MDGIAGLTVFVMLRTRDHLRNGSSIRATDGLDETSATLFPRSERAPRLRITCLKQLLLQQTKQTIFGSQLMHD